MDGTPYVESLLHIQATGPNLSGGAIRSVQTTATGASRLSNPDRCGIGKRCSKFVKIIGNVECCCETVHVVNAILHRLGGITACQDWSEARRTVLGVLETGSTWRGGVGAKEPDLCADSLEGGRQYHIAQKQI